MSCTCVAMKPVLQVCVHEGTNCRHHTSEPDLPLDNHPRAPGYIWTGEGLCIARLYLAPEPAVKSTIHTVGMTAKFHMWSLSHGNSGGTIWSAVTSSIGKLPSALSSTSMCLYKWNLPLLWSVMYDLCAHVWSLCTLFKWLCILYTAQVQCSTWCRPRTETGWSR